VGAPGKVEKTREKLKKTTKNVQKVGKTAKS
jgi:hypothetical protein